MSQKKRMPRVAMTGITSFTGAWIAQTFVQKGWEVYGLCSQALSSYSGLSTKRLEWLQKQSSQQNRIQIQYELPVETGALSTWVAQNSFDIWIHHHHWMKDFRAPHYDLHKAAQIGLEPLPELLAALKKTGILGMIHSGSFFEPGEGKQKPEQKITPYAQSKADVWKQLEKEAGRLELPLSKILIPNPVGPLENADRLPSVMIEKARKKEKITLRAPHSQTDFLPIMNLAEHYCEVAEKLLENKPAITRPSGLQCTVQEWIELMNRELFIQRLHLDPIEIEIPAQLDAITTYLNPREEKIHSDWTSFWDTYAQFIEEAKS